MAWSDGLLEDQFRAAAHTGTHARLLAGPGTGKTLTLTRRLLKLVLEDHIPPEQILAVAFTRVNAYDFNRSVSAEFIKHGLSTPHISTLHSYALSQLLRNSALIRALPQPIRIADDYEERNIIRPDLGSLLGLNDRDIRNKLAELSSDWQDLRVDEQPYLPADPRFMGAWQEHRTVYGYTLRSELVWQLKHAMEENPDHFDIGGKISHLLVDEYQDLNRCDLAVVAAIAATGAEVYCAGDDDQSIYSFRGAYPEGIRRFTDEFQPSTPLELEVCWRSDRRIIELGQYIANLDPQRLPKPIRARDGAGLGEVHLLRFPDQDAESEGIAAICAHLLSDVGLSPEEILILLRSDHQARYSSPVREALQARGLAVSVRAEREGPLDTPSGRQVLSLLRMAQNPGDNLAWRTVLHLVRKENQIGDKTIASLYEFARQQRIPFIQALTAAEGDPTAFPRGSYVAMELTEIRAVFGPLASIPAPDPSQLQDPAYRLQQRQRLLALVSSLSDTLAIDPAERAKILQHITATADRWDSASLPDLVAALTSPEDTLDQELDPGKVNILSMHRAKGLSATAVIVFGVEEELIPGDNVGPAYEDERRLLYVSFTRAKRFLFATFCNRRTGRQRHSGRSPGNPKRTLTPFLRGAPSVEDGRRFVAQLIADGLCRSAG